MKPSISLYGLTGILICGIAVAQTPVPVASTPTTLWNFLGIPQGWNKLQDAGLNKFGNHPNLERKPPLKRLGDPANLLSDNKAIKAAAEIKQAEDLKQQKIKAIKYLGTIGCGCYNKNGEVTDALIAAMDDCTEPVRYEAVLAVISASTSEVCVNCKVKSCCSKKMMKKLYEIAYERGDDCCYLEPSQRVREAAMQAMRTCGCHGDKIFDDMKEEVEKPEPNKTPKPPEPGPQKEVPRTEEAAKEGTAPLPPLNLESAVKTLRTTSTADAPSAPVAMTRLPEATSASPLVKSKPIPMKNAPTVAAIPAGSVPASFASNTSKPARVAPTAGAIRFQVSDSGAQETTASASSAQPVNSDVQGTKAPAIRFPAPQSSSATSTTSVQPLLVGQIEIVKAAENMVGVSFESDAVLAKGSRVNVYRTYLTGKTKIGELEVIDSDAGRAVCRPLDGLVASKLERGTEVSAMR